MTARCNYVDSCCVLHRTIFLVENNMIAKQWLMKLLLTPPGSEQRIMHATRWCVRNGRFSSLSSVLPLSVNLRLRDSRMHTGRSTSHHVLRKHSPLLRPMQPTPQPAPPPFHLRGCGPLLAPLPFSRYKERDGGLATALQPKTLDFPERQSFAGASIRTKSISQLHYLCAVFHCTIAGNRSFAGWQI